MPSFERELQNFRQEKIAQNFNCVPRLAQIGDFHFSAQNCVFLEENFFDRLLFGGQLSHGTLTMTQLITIVVAATPPSPKKMRREAT